MKSLRLQLLIMFMGIVFAPASAQAQIDTEPPELVSWSINPATVDITDSAGLVTLNLRVTDSLTGLANGGIGFYESSSGEFRDYHPISPDSGLVSGDANDGTYQIQVTIPRFIPSTEWTVIVNLGDAGGNHVTYEDGFEHRPFPGGAGSTITIVNNGPVDVDAPTIANLSFTADTVDVSNAPGTVEVTIQVTDAQSGLADGYIFLINPAGDFFRRGDFAPDFQQISGDPNDGTYRVPISFPQYLPAGQWRVAVALEDVSGNYIRFGAGSRDSAFPTPGSELFTVINNGPTDIDPPGIANLMIIPPSVDVTSVEGTVDVELRITDPLAGLNSGTIYLVDPDDNRLDGQNFYPGNNQLSGDARDGIYRVSIPVRRFVAPGQWSLYVGLQDANSNYVSFAAQPHEAALPSGAPRYVEVTNSGQVDEESPRIVSLSISAPSVDVSTTDQNVIVSLRVTDLLSGLDYGHVGGQFFDEADRTSGDAMDGTYEVTIPVSRFRQPGQLDLAPSLYDQLGNGHGLDSQYLPAGAPQFIEVINTGEIDDADPELVSLSLSSPSVDVSSTAASVDVTFRLTDAQSGISWGCIDLIDNRGGYIAGYCFSADDRIQGDANDGTYRSTITIPPFTDPGQLFPRVQISDAIGHNVYDLPAPDPASSLLVTNTAPSDDAPPELVSMSVSAMSVDSSSGNQSVTITLRAADVGSGIDYIGVDAVDERGNNLWDQIGDAELVSGTPHDGTYELVLDIPRFLAPGKIFLHPTIQDLAGNGRYYVDKPSTLPFPEPISGEFDVINIVSVFAQSLGNAGLDPGTVMLGGDLDGDGVRNGVEVLIGGAVDAPDAGRNAPQLVADPQTGGFCLRFTVNPAFIPEMNGAWLELSDGRTGAPPLRVSGQSGTTLTSWSMMPPQSVGGGTFEIPIPDGENGFARLLIEN